MKIPASIGGAAQVLFISSYAEVLAKSAPFTESPVKSDSPFHFPLSPKPPQVASERVGLNTVDPTAWRFRSDPFAPPINRDCPKTSDDEQSIRNTSSE